MGVHIDGPGAGGSMEPWQARHPSATCFDEAQPCEQFDGCPPESDGGLADA